MRRDFFFHGSESRCEAFYVETTSSPKTCHMVPPSKKDDTSTSMSGFTYYKKLDAMPVHVFTTEATPTTT